LSAQTTGENLRSNNFGDEKVMNKKLILYIAIGLGVVAGAMNWIYLTKAEGAQLKVLKAKERIPAGQPVNREQFEAITFSGDVAKMKTVVIPEDDFAAFANRSLAETLEPGQILLLRSFQLTGEGGIRDGIGEGQRALSIEVRNEENAVAYFVKPGDSVDVWAWIGNTPYKIKGRACVRAIGDAHFLPNDTTGKEGRYRTVTLVVKEEDVRGLLANVTLAEGKVFLTLVGACEANDLGDKALDPITVAQHAITESNPKNK
jgi:Flp pilus assembly protein CpaB